MSIKPPVTDHSPIFTDGRVKRKTNEATDLSSNYTISSPTDRCMRRATKELYRALKDNGSLNSQIKTCGKFFANAINPSGKLEEEKECCVFAERTFFAKEVCKSFIKSEEEFYETGFGSFLHSIQEVFKSVFGLKTGKDKIIAAKQFVANIENDNRFKGLMVKVNDIRFEKCNYENEITDKEGLENALKIWQDRCGFTITNLEKIKITFPEANATKLMQSEVIELKNVFSDHGGPDGSGKDRSLVLMRDHNNHWYAVFENDITNQKGTGANKLVLEGWDLSLNKPVAIGININTENIDKDLGSINGIKREYGTYKTKLDKAEPIVDEAGVDEGEDGAKSIVKMHTLFIKKTISKDGAKVEKTCYSIQELYDSSLQSKITPKEHGKISLKDKNNIARDIIIAIKYIHDKGLIHRDIKPGNILLKKIKEFIRAFVADFDTVCSKDDIKERKKSVGTRSYVPPELIKQKQGESGIEITQKFDIWSLGVTLYELYYGEFFFQSLDDIANKDACAINEAAHAKNRPVLVGIKFQEYVDSKFLEYVSNLKQADINDKFKKDAKINQSVPKEINKFINSLIRVNQEERPDIETVQKAYEAIREKLANRNISTSNVSALPIDSSSDAENGIF